MRNNGPPNEEPPPAPPPPPPKKMTLYGFPIMFVESLPNYEAEAANRKIAQLQSILRERDTTGETKV